MSDFDFTQFQKKPKKVVPQSVPKNVPKRLPQVKPKTSCKPHKDIDLRDEMDQFVHWIKQVKPQDFTGKREAIVKRVQTYKRPSFVEGTIELLTKYLKEKGFKVIQ
jgi:hypothetical protein